MRNLSANVWEPLNELQPKADKQRDSIIAAKYSSLSPQKKDSSVLKQAIVVLELTSFSLYQKYYKEKTERSHTHDTKGFFFKKRGFLVQVNVSSFRSINAVFAFKCKMNRVT